MVMFDWERRPKYHIVIPLLIAMFVISAQGEGDTYGLQGEAQQSYNRALRYRGMKEHDKAIGELKQMTIKYSSFYRAYLSLWKLYERTGQSAEAKRYFQDRLSEDQDNTYVNYVLGLMRQQDSDFEQAGSHFRRCIELAPDFIPAYKSLVDIAEKRGELEELLCESADKINERGAVGAGAHFTIGCIYRLRRGWEKAETFFKTAMRMSSRSWELQYPIFQVYFDSDRLNEALTVAHEIYSRSSESDDLEIMEIISAAIGQTYIYLDNYAQAASFLDQSIRISREIGSNRGRVQSYLANRGLVYHYQGKYKQAIEVYKQALSMAPEGNDRSSGLSAGRTIGLIGTIHTLSGDYSQALAAFTQALEIARKTGDWQNECDLLPSLGMVYLVLDDDSQAIEVAQEAIKIARKKERPRLEVDALRLLGRVHEKSGRWREAIDSYLQSLSIAKRNEDRNAEATILADIGGVYASTRDYSKALSNYEQALSIARKIGDVNIEAGIHNKLGGLRLQMGQYDHAAADHERALELGNRIQSLETIWHAQAGLAMSMEKQRRFDAALDYYRQAIETVERIRGKLDIAEDKTGYLADKIEIYHQLVRLLIELGKEKEAFHYAERARARSLSDLLTEAGAEALGQPDIDSDLRDRLTETGAQISRIQSRLGELYSEKTPNMESIKRLEAERDKTAANYLTLQREDRQRHPRYAAEPINLEQAQGMLNDQTLLLEYVLGQEGSYLFAVSKKECRVVRLPETQLIDGRVRKLRGAVAWPHRRAVSIYITQAKLLYQDLIRPIETMLSGKKELIISPDGILHYLPFELLIPTNSPIAARPNWRLLPYLISDYGISYVSSASVRAALGDRYKEPQNPPKLLLAYADPVYSNETRLEYSRDEVEGIGKLYPLESVDIFLGEAANEESVKAEGKLGQYRAIHFAVHGLLYESRPQLSGLALSPQGIGREDGLLQVYEIFKLRLRAELVILSACKTGLGKGVKGEGLIGLTQAFMYAGAQSVVVSLWEVLDLSTAKLMIEFHRRLGDQPVNKVEALRQAKLQLIHNTKFAHPYHWASFVLVGKS